MKDISVSFVTTALIQGLNILTGLLAARLLLPEGRGELAAIMLWPGLIAELGNLGLYDAMLYRAATRAANPRDLFAAVAALLGLLTIVLAAIGLVVIPIALAGYGSDVEIIALYFLCAFLPSYFMSLFTGGMFQGHLQMTIWNVLRAAVPVVYFTGIVVLSLVAGPEVASFAAAYIMAQLAAGLLGFVLLYRRGWISWRPRLDVMKGLVAYGVKVHVGEILFSLRQRLDQAVISLWLPAADLGLYVVALTVANGPLILVHTLANVAFPKISQQETVSCKIVVFGRYLRFSMAIAVATIGTLMVLIPWLVPLLFGRPFAPAVPIAGVLLLGTAPLAAKLMFQQALKAWDRSLVISRAELIGLVTAAGLIAVLMPPFGLEGAAWSVVLSQVVTAGVMAVSLKRDLGLPIVRLFVPTADDWALSRLFLRKCIGLLRKDHG